MRPMELALVYLVLGVGVSVAWHRLHGRGAAWALPFWPLFVPGLLLQPVAAEAPVPASAWQGRIQGAVAELSGALDCWEGMPDSAMLGEALEAATRGLGALADRHQQLEAVLARGEHDPERLERELEGASDVARPLLEARLRNLHTLRGLRDQARGELERGLAGMADLATRVHVARFTGDEAGRIAEQLQDLAAAVDSVGELSRLG